MGVPNGRMQPSIKRPLSGLFGARTASALALALAAATVNAGELESLTRIGASAGDEFGYASVSDGNLVIVSAPGEAAVTDKVDHAVGFSNLIKIGEPVSPGTRLCILHVNDDAKAARAEALIREAVKFTPTAPKQEPLVQDLIQ